MRPCNLLACPVCGLELSDRDRAAACAAGHSFDYARSGYLNLLLRSGRRGDTAEMVRARADFLASGHFDPIAKRVAELAAEASPDTVAELGSGTGHYLAAARALLASDTCAFGFDLSKAACANAARAHPGIRFAVADAAQQIPLLGASVDAVLSVFAPRPAAELARVLRPGGALVVAMGTERHLAATRERLDLIGVQQRKLERLAERLAGAFELAASEPLEYEVELAPADVQQVVAMGPNAWHGKSAPPEPILDRVSVLLARFVR